MKIFVTIIFNLFMVLSVSAAGWEEAEIELSDGRRISGKLSLMGNRPLTITPAGEKYQQKILLSDILILTQIVREQKMNRPWLYKEAGKVEKMYLEGNYPFINFTTEIVLTGGKVIRGDIISAAFRFKGQGPGKFFLTRQIKGKVGEKMDDLVYPLKITFNNRKATVKPIIVTLAGAGKIQSAAALDNEREVVRFGRTEGSKIIFDELFDAEYDIYVLTDSEVLGGLSDAAPADRKGGALPDNAPAELNKVFPLADDFFSERRILALSGNEKFCKTLVYKRREKYYHSDKHTPGGWIWHLDVWSWHLAGNEWKIDRRHIMVRHKQQGGEKIRKLFLVRALGAVKPGAELTVDLNGERQNGVKFITELK
ncbi:MAG: hypothetical protein PHV82_08630 [Victivallaceae bacterium]|nr:hypothetical protein [Victivallaceae bacterium]